MRIGGLSMGKLTHRKCITQLMVEQNGRLRNIYELFSRLFTHNDNGDISRDS